MIERHLKTELIKSLRKFPVVGLFGARQVGKTTLAKLLVDDLEKSAVYLDLERPSDLAKLAEPELYLESHSQSVVVLDEIQRRPDLFPLLRALVDSDRRPGRFLILGSASPDMMRQSSESLAGRIVYHELSPICMKEIGSDSRKMWNAAKIATSLGVSAPTVRHYLDILESTFMVRPLQPFHASVKKRLVKSPKMYLRDSGILHFLLGIQNHEDLLSHPCAGSSWEGWAIEQVLSVLPKNWRFNFYRTSAGAEIDLLIQPAGRRPPVAIEVKFSLDPKPSRGFWSALSDLGNAYGYLAYPGTERYPIGENAYALPVKDLDRVPLVE